MNDSEERNYLIRLLEQLYTERKLRRIAKTKLAEELKETQGCEYYFDFGGCHCYSEKIHPPIPEEEMCDNCKASKPLHDDFVKHSRASGAVLRKLLSIGKSYSELY